MKTPSPRRPVALANWKMAMMVSECLDFIKKFRTAVDRPAPVMDIILCPPATAIYPLSQELAGSPIELGAQDLCAAPDLSHTGELSAGLLGDAGCKWALLGHWEVRRRTGETDSDVNMKMNAAFGAGLRPVICIGEGAEEKGKGRDVLAERLPRLFGDCESTNVRRSIVLYEPEWTIGGQSPASTDTIAECCSFIRDWIGQTYGTHVAEVMRIIYGGSVFPQHTRGLTDLPDVDGLGAGRMGRDPAAFARIVGDIALSKGLL